MKKLKWILVVLGLVASVAAFTNVMPSQKKIKKGNKTTACVLEDLATSGLGDVKYSILSPAKFQQINGTGWVLMTDSTKSSLGITTEISVFDYLDSANESTTNLPDGRGVFLRSKNNSRSDGKQDPGGERALGSYQLDDIIAHSHGYAAPDLKTTTGTGGDDGSTKPVAKMTATTGGAETRPRNIVVNTYIKVKRNCLDAVTMSMVSQNTAAIQTLQNYNNENLCDACLGLSEGNLSDLQTKATCFKDEIDLYEADQKKWSVTCTARTVGYAKKVLMLIGPNRDTDDNAWLSHLDNQYPYYNVISTN